MIQYFNLIKDNGEKTECRFYEGKWEKFDRVDYFIEFSPEKDFPGLSSKELRDALDYGGYDIQYDLDEGYRVHVCPDEHNVGFKLVREEKEDVLVPFSVIEDDDMEEYYQWKWNLPYFASGVGDEIFWDVYYHTKENYLCCEPWQDWDNCINYEVDVEVNPSDVAKSDEGVVVRLSHEIMVKGYADLENEDFGGFPAVYWMDDQGFYDDRCPVDLDFDEGDWDVFYELIEFDQKIEAIHELGDWTFIINEGDSNE